MRGWRQAAAAGAVLVVLVAWIGQSLLIPSPAPPPAPEDRRVPAPVALLDLPPPLRPESAWVTWYGPDGRIYRRPITDAYRELYAALQRSLAEDRLRLQLLSRRYLQREVEPVLSALGPRLEPFLERMASLTAGLDRLRQAVGSVPPGSADFASSAAREQALQAALTEALVDAFDSRVLGGGAARRQLRTATGRALELLRSDLLQLCDRYDRAFRWFILHTPGSVWVLTEPDSWRPAQGWRAVEEAIPSLCQGLRLAPAGAGPAVEQALDMTLDTLTVAVRTTFQPPVRRTAQAAAELARQAQGYAERLRGLGWSADLAWSSALVGAYLTSAWTVLRTAWDGLGGDLAQTELAIDLGIALAAVPDTVRLRLHEILDDYVAAELERMALGLDARSRGAWSSR
jgi:hypothetical protein